MKFVNKIKDFVERIPYLRRPERHSQWLQYIIDNQWAFRTKDKASGAGWNSYYEGMRNVWVNACINAYIKEMHNVGFIINNPEEDKIDLTNVSYLTSLFQDPMGYNSNDTYTLLTELLWRSKLGLGDAFCEVIYDPEYSKIPIGLKHIPCEYLRFYDDTSQWGFRNNPNKRFERDNLIHIYTPSIKGSHWGVSPLDYLSTDIANEILANQFLKETLENKGINPSGVIEFEKDMDKEDFDTHMEYLTEQAKKPRKATLVLKGAKYYSIGGSLQDMEYNSMLENIRLHTLATYGVPPSKVSIIETASLGTGTGESQDKNFKKNITGESKLFEDGFKKVLGRAGFKEFFQYGEMDIEDKKLRTQIENIRLRNGSLTINEVRAGYGEEEVEWGKEPLITNNRYNINNDNNSMSLLSDYKKILHNKGLIK